MVAVVGRGCLVRLEAYSYAIVINKVITVTRYYYNAAAVHVKRCSESKNDRNSNLLGLGRMDALLG
jgi:hypothetical protein